MDLFLRTEAECTTFFHEEMTRGRMGVAAPMWSPVIVFLLTKKVIFCCVEVFAPCGRTGGFFEQLDLVSVFQPVFDGTDYACLFAPRLCFLVHFGRPLIQRARHREHAKELEALHQTPFQPWQ